MSLIEWRTRFFRLPQTTLFVLVLKLNFFPFRNAGADKIRRYINYLFHQKSFYPLFPPKMPTDLRLLHEYGLINKIPNILVVPSDMKYYMRVSRSPSLTLFILIYFPLFFTLFRTLTVVCVLILVGWWLITWKEQSRESLCKRQARLERLSTLGCLVKLYTYSITTFLENLLT